MTDLRAATARILQGKSGSPFLFVGSGFSRRYIGLEDWDGLLTRFCEGIEPFDYYRASADGDLPTAAALMANDFHNVWWKDPRFSASREKYKATTKTRDAALKNEICEYLSHVDVSGLADDKVQGELAILRGLNVDGIITTNWDFLLEEIFPEYRVFVGQEELLFSNPQAIAEIYKIHGCASQPQSLVLTQDDYKDFHEKNPYLAAKLITLFIEHPIFFIGYSVNDPHIQSIIFSIASCLGPDKLDQFSDNLIFVRRANGKEDSVQKFTFSEGGRNVVATVLETDDFRSVYQAIDQCKRKIPARILRYCKEQMYELVKSEAPEKKLAVVDIDELDSSDEVEFVVGLGVAADHSARQSEIATEGEKALSENGYKGIDLMDLYIDLPQEKSKFDADRLLRVAFPLLAKSNATFIPVFRYLSELGIKNAEDLAASEYDGAKTVIDRIRKKEYFVRSYIPQFEREWSEVSTSDIIAGVSSEKVAQFVTLQNPESVDIDALRNFLKSHKPSDFRDPYASFFRKLCCFYDRIVYGF